MRLAVIFLLLFIGAECAVELNEPFGTIESANYPDPYPDNTNQTWILNTRPGYQIIVYFTVFDLEDSYDEELGGDCVYDYVELEHLGSRHRFCGKANHRWRGNAPQIRNKFRSESNQMVINFVSDYLNENPRPIGFKAHFFHDDKDECAKMSDMVANTVEDWDDLIYCDHFCVNVPGSYYCGCRHGYVLHSNKHTCTGDCRNEIIHSGQNNGQIQTPEYPSKYSKLTDCQWNIQVREGLSLNFNFSTTFDIEDHYNYTNCPYDFLKLVYGDQQEKFCGSVAPAPVMTNTRIARLEFHTDNSVEKAGFQVSYTTTRIRCNEHPRSPSNGQILTNITETRGYYEFEDVVEFKCDDGYNLVGMQNITCQGDGTWNSNDPICQIKTCDSPVKLTTIPHSTLTGVKQNFTYTDMVNVTCDQWYEHFGTVTWICNKNSEWVAVEDESWGVIPKCTPICGQKGTVNLMKEIASAQISQGRDARPGEWPWIAFIDILDRGLDTDHRFCGGSLVNERYVVTAAHCFNDYSVSGLVGMPVYLGVHDRQNPTDPHIQRFVVEEVYIHQEYSGNENSRTMYDNDIAVLKLNQSADINAWVRPICIPKTLLEQSLPDFSQDDPNFHKRASIAGWGKTGSSERMAQVLQTTRVPVVRKQDCETDFEEHDLSVTKNMICAGFQLGGRDSCAGDSGGPFSFKLKTTKKWFLNGVVSFGRYKRCGAQYSYGVYTKVANYLPWINAHIQD